MKLELNTYTLPLKNRFRISREAIDTQDSLVASLSLEGHTGYGEVTSNQYYKATIPGLLAEIVERKTAIESYPLEHPDGFYEMLVHSGLSNFACCALDMAAHDLYGKIKGKPLYEIWGTDISHYPTTNYTIGIDSTKKMLEKIKERPWPIYKIKLGTARDMEILTELRKHTDAVFRIDANAAWTASQTISYAPVMKDLGVELIEQPLPADDWEGMEKVLHHSVLPVFADESCVGENDVEKCALHFNGINIKLSKCGGLTPALRMIKKGREMGLKIMAGCMTESTVGISAVAQLLPQLDYVDMDGAMLLASDIASGAKVMDNTRVRFPDLGGTGVRLL